MSLNLKETLEIGQLYHLSKMIKIEYVKQKDIIRLAIIAWLFLFKYSWKIWEGH